MFDTVLPVAAGILDPLYIAFGWMLRVLYQLFSNYGVVIIVFSILLRLILLPLNVRSSKSSIKMTALQPQIAELQRQYGNDRTGLAQAQQALYKKHNVSMLGGCLPALFQLIIIWPIWRIFQAPMRYVSNVAVENLESVGRYLESLNLISSAEANNAAGMNIPLMRALRENAAALAEVVNNGWLRLSDMLNLNFLGLNLGLVPTYNPGALFGPEWNIWLPLLSMPVFAVVSTILLNKTMEWTNPAARDAKKQRAAAERNPAARQSPQEDQTAGMGKMMRWFMPIMTLITTFSMPAAMGLYWLIGNLVGIAQQVLIYYLYIKPAYLHNKDNLLIIKPSEPEEEEPVRRRRKRPRPAAGDTGDVEAGSAEPGSAGDGAKGAGAAVAGGRIKASAAERRSGSGAAAGTRQRTSGADDGSRRGEQRGQRKKK
ncbi:MAG: YidC/Oxa1 family membrane protein insertase [Clostridiaceae bacterium]|nr:YidC/Oxa1 family membrane protein insertase [Clostridiaceae bacterium]